MEHDIIAIGASAGGLEAIFQLLSALPADLPAAVLIALHRPIDYVTYLPELLQRRTGLHVRVALEGDRLEHGTCYVAPSDRHLTVVPGPRIHLLRDGFYRAHTIDALFGSLAHSAGGRTIAVVLSGALKDGTLGLKSIKEMGGLALVQDPTEAKFKDMPISAIQHDGEIDCIGTTDELAEFICLQLGRSSLASAITAPNRRP